MYYYKLSIESFSQSVLESFYFDLSFYLNFKFYINNNKSKNKNFLNHNIYYLQKSIKKYTLNKSPHINKKAREQFETRIYKAIIKIKPKNSIILKKIDYFYIFYFLKQFTKNSFYVNLIKSRLKLIKKEVKFSLTKSFSIKKDKKWIILINKKKK